MRALNRLFARLLNFVFQRRSAARIKEEIDAHLAAQTEENVRAGMDPTEALRQARLKFGSIELVREDYRAEQGLPVLEQMLTDVHYAFRVLRKSPVFTLVAVLTLMLGVGTNVVVGGILDAVLLRPLEISDPGSLYQLRTGPRMSGGMLTTSYPAFEDFQQRNTTFTGMAAANAYSGWTALAWDRNAALKVRGVQVTGNYFDLLGVRAERGKFFQPADIHGPGSAPVVVVSDQLWRTAFAADPDIIGMTVSLNRHPFTIVAVTPASFHGTERFEWPDYWMPIMNAAQVEGGDFLHSHAQPAVSIIGRLKPGTTVQQATDELNAIASHLAIEHPSTDRGISARLIHPGLFGDDGEVIWGFLGGVMLLALLLLAAACANLASLFAARAADRGRELALRVALGSNRLRLVRQLLTEAVVVSLIGGTAGLVVAYGLLAALNRWQPSFGYGGQRLGVIVEFDPRVYGAGLLLSLGSALLFGMVGARRAWRADPLQMIKGGSTPMRRQRLALGDLLLGAQIALCALLMAGSLVAVRSMERALHAPLGVNPRGVSLAEVDLSQSGPAYDALAMEKTMMDTARNLPGVTAVGAISAPPMGGGRHGVPIYPPGTIEFTANNEGLSTRVYVMSPGYLNAAGTRLMAGRDVSWRDLPNTLRAAVVNRTFARSLWGETTAIGQRFLLWGKLTEVIGVTEDGKYHDLMEKPQAAVYLPLSQHGGTGGIVLVVKSVRPPNEMAAVLRRTLTDLEPTALITVTSWPEALGGVLFPARAAAFALGVMGVLASMLAVTGIFGMAAYNVSRRKKELGIRMALGAGKIQVLRTAIARPVILLGLGSAVGLAGEIVAHRFLRQIVYQADGADPTLLITAMIAMALLGLAGSAIPAKRALAVDPAKLMREE